MKIARLLDTAGQTHFGSPIDAGRARRLVGDLYAELTETDEVLTVARWLAPVRPVNIFCIGLNYRAHAGETGKAVPAAPVVFMKPTTTISNPGDPIPLPRACDQGPEVDYEAELAVVIGRTARDVPASHALGHVWAIPAPTMSPPVTGNSSWGAANGFAARASTASARSAPGWSPWTRSPIPRRWGSPAPSTASASRTDTPARCSFPWQN